MHDGPKHGLHVGHGEVPGGVEVARALTAITSALGLGEGTLAPEGTLISLTGWAGASLGYKTHIGALKTSHNTVALKAPEKPTVLWCC